MLRRRLLLQEFNIRIIYRKGVSNVATDALSYLPLQQPDEPLPLYLMEARFSDSYAFHSINNFIQAIYPFNFEYLQQQIISDKNLQTKLKQLPSTFHQARYLSSYLSSSNVNRPMEDRTTVLITPLT